MSVDEKSDLSWCQQFSEEFEALCKKVEEEKRDKQQQQLIEASTSKLAQKLKIKPSQDQSFKIKKIDAEVQTNKSYLNYIRNREKYKNKKLFVVNLPMGVVMVYDEFNKPSK